MPLMFEWLGWLIVGFACAALLGSSPAATLTPAGVLLQLLFSVLLAVPGVVFIMERRNQTIGFDAQRLYVTDLFGRLRSYEWSEIEDVSSTGTSAMLRLRMRSGRKVKISQFFLGFLTFVEALEHHTGFLLRRKPRPVLWWTR